MIIIIIIILIVCCLGLCSSSIISLAGGGGGLYFLTGNEESESEDNNSTDSQPTSPQPTSPQPTSPPPTSPPPTSPPPTSPQPTSPPPTSPQPTSPPPTYSSALDSFSLLNSQYGQAGRNDKILKDKTAESCAKACLDETSFNCKSFDFTDDGLCYLSKSIVSDGGSYNKSYPGYKYYEKKGTKDSTTSEISSISSVSDTKIGFLAKEYYRTKGEWKGTYIINSITKINVVNSKTVDIAYKYALASKPSSPLGTDYRRFTFNLSALSVSSMGSYHSGTTVA